MKSAGTYVGRTEFPSAQNEIVSFVSPTTSTVTHDRLAA